MNQNTLGSMVFSATKGLLVAILKLVFTIAAWVLQVVGLLSQKLSEIIQRIINKRL